MQIPDGINQIVEEFWWDDLDRRFGALGGGKEPEKTLSQQSMKVKYHLMKDNSQLDVVPFVVSFSAVDHLVIWSNARQTVWNTNKIVFKSRLCVLIFVCVM